jgi:hypothetical protein
MADLTHKPFSGTRVTAEGFTFEIVEVRHTYRVAGGEATTFEVDPSASHAVHLPKAGQTAVTVTFDGTAENLSDPGSNVVSYGKTVSIPSTSASGDYTFVIRHAGEAGGFKNDL